MVVLHAGSRNFEIYFGNHETPNLLSYHSRLQPWIMFYIDAASYLDSDDPNWHYFLMFERYDGHFPPKETK